MCRDKDKGIETNMQYIVLDLEWNQAPSREKTVTTPVRLSGEIIQIGAVRVSEAGEILETLKCDVRPRHYTQMHYKIREITGITSAQLRRGIPFETAYRQLADFVGTDSVFLTWGPDDLPMLRTNMALYGYDTEALPRSYDLQLIFNAAHIRERRQCSLAAALELLHMEQSPNMHDALADAYDTARIAGVLDVAAGIADYETITEQYGSLSCGPAVEAGHYDTFEDALADPRVTTAECPKCGAVMACTSFETPRFGKTSGLTACPDHPEHGVYSLRVRIAKDKAAGGFNARKQLYRATEAEKERWAKR